MDRRSRTPYGSGLIKIGEGDVVNDSESVYVGHRTKNGWEILDCLGRSKF